MRARHLAIVAAVAATIAGAGAATPDLAEIIRPTRHFTRAEPYEANSAGAATGTGAFDRSAFSRPSGNMSFERQLDFKVGDGVFRKLWVSAPSSTRSSDGLGPLFNARSCQSCHLKDGRGQPPAPGEAAVSMFLRLSVPPTMTEEKEKIAGLRLATVDEPTYGGQLQNFSVQGHLAEGEMKIDYAETAIRLNGGEIVKLRRPTYSAANLNYGPMRSDVMLSPRVAPPMIGMGLLERIPAADIEAFADPDDRDGDGISGRANRIWGLADGKPMLGRFGWKAGQPTIAQQVAHAFAGDMGLSTTMVAGPWGDCTSMQKECRQAPHGSHGEGEIEVAPKMFDLVVFYSQNLAVPARRKVDAPEVLRGKKLFYESGCIGCHRPKFVTGEDPAQPELSGQLIWPYSDLLLHDMGEGLADQRPEGLADGREWRTPPLWGIGLTETVSGHSFFLHDGRARNLLEAILWHGGEAEAAKQKVVRMTKAERAALLAFLRSL